jgi:class 3 adenylate cyclase
MAEPPSGTVTLLFSDIEGSTRLLQRTGDAYADLLAEHHRLLREACEQHLGFVVDGEGDALFVAFASAAEATLAAAEAQQALARHPWPDENEIRVRIGLHTGEPRSIDGRYIGLDVHQAARVMAAGHGGQVLLSESTRTLLDERFEVRDLGEHRLKDLSGSQHLYQLHVEGLPAEFPPLKTLDNRPTNLPVQPNAFIGRLDDLEELQATTSAWSRSPAPEEPARLASRSRWPRWRSSSSPTASSSSPWRRSATGSWSSQPWRRRSGCASTPASPWSRH